jgi:hypothetical protein
MAATWTRLKIVVNSLASSVEFFINGVSVGANITNIPSGAGRALGALMLTVKSVGLTTRDFYVDWIWLHIDLSVSR